MEDNLLVVHRRLIKARRSFNPVLTLPIKNLAVAYLFIQTLKKISRLDLEFLRTIEWRKTNRAIYGGNIALIFLFDHKLGAVKFV